MTKSPTSGFTIRRSENILDSAPDLETAETELEVKYDLNTFAGNKTIDRNNTKGESDPTVIAINDPKNVDKKNDSKTNNDIKKVIPSPIIVNETKTDIQTSGGRKLEISSETPKIISTETTNYSYTTSAPSTSQTTTRQPERNQDLSTKSTSYTSLVIESQIGTFNKYTNVTTEKDIVEQTIKDNEAINIESSTEPNGTPYNQNSSEPNAAPDYQNSSEPNAAPDNQNSSEPNAAPYNQNSSEPNAASDNLFDYLKGEIDYTEKQDTTTSYFNDVNNSVNKINDSTTEDTYALRKEVVSSILDTLSKIQNFTAVAEIKTDQTNAKGEIFTPVTDRSFDALVTTISESETDITKVTFEVPTTESTTEKYFTKTVSTDMYPSTLPRKKYTTIDRKRTNTEDTDAPGKDMARAETGQTRMSLEKVFNDTPILSLEKLKIDFTNAQESTTKKLETTNSIEANVSSAPDIETSSYTQIMAAGIGIETTKLEMVSKRAGYKDNRETTTLKPEEATTSEFPPKVSAKNTEMFSSMYETEPSEVEVLDNKNNTVYESQSQLNEDAIKEELLKEETINDNEENLKRHHDDRITAPRVKPLKQGKVADDGVTMPEMATEDMLSVKPISFNKKKNEILYAVSPNYKPLKKIDVQPPKQFVRDPDDNSWRNESISSLGIVFKPKNASKSFTQVLKNKTEIELGNMADKDSKGDVPDLRVRLEKIAEVRKYKKRIKFGDTVYSDYEESGENVNFAKEDTTSPISPPVESVFSFNQTLPPKSSTPEYDLTVNAISREKLDFFKNERTTPLTTNKPKKFYNLNEYYDATDEYDADYVNLHKIDLKKFTQPLKPKDTPATQLPELLNTKPMKEYTPERKATVQYFPPTQKISQKVNMNDYDTDFNRKLNLYTFKEPPQNVLAASFGTVSPVQTEKHEQPKKNTVKPAFTPIMYKVENLDKNLYLTNQPRVAEQPSGFVPNDGNFNRASYVIKHYRDFINEAAKEGEDERSVEYPYTEPPLRGVTVNELAKMTTPRDSNQGEEEYDYDVKFRKDVINRFVDNFNQNSERFKVDFPILYNSSVVHKQTPENGKVASSSAFLKRLYEVGNPRPSNFLSHRRPCDPHCDNMTVELSPAYELHYYVPDQEEKEEIEPRPITVPYRYRL